MESQIVTLIAANIQRINHLIEAHTANQVVIVTNTAKIMMPAIVRSLINVIAKIMITVIVNIIINVMAENLIRNVEDKYILK